MAIAYSTCYADGCARQARSRGLCNRHYENLRRYGYEIPRRDWTIERTLDDTGWEITASGCWEWRGARNEHGYGLVSLARRGITAARAHRIMYERFVGTIPDGQVIRHKCDNPPCVNPAHLEAGTQYQNIMDMVERGRHCDFGRTECRNGHPITDPSSYRVQKRSGRDDERVCLRCQRERHVRWQEKKKFERAKLRDVS